MTSPRQQKSTEVLRTGPKSGKDLERELKKIDDSAKKHAEELEKLEIDPVDLKAIHKLEPDPAPETQNQGIYAMSAIIENLMARLKQKNEKINLHNISPYSLLKKVMENGLKLESYERLAVEKYAELVSETGATAYFLKGSWLEMVSSAEEAAKGWSKKLSDMWKKDKVGTLGLLAVGAVGTYLGYKAIKGIWGWITGKGKANASATIATATKGGFLSNLMPSGKSLGILGILATGLFLGRGELKKLLYAQFGLKLGDKDLGEIAKNIEDGKMKAVERKIAEWEKKMEKKEDESKKKLEKIEEKLSFTGPRDILIKLYCANEFKYSPFDISNIKTVFNNLRAVPVATIAAEWNKYKKQEGEYEERQQRTMPKAGFDIGKSVTSYNVYTAFKIITLTFEGYKKQFSDIDTSTMTLEDFLRNHIAKDPAHKINSSIHENLAGAIAAGKPGAVKLRKKIKSAIETDKEGYFLEDICRHLGVNMDELTTDEERNDFYTIAFKDLYGDANLKMDVKGALRTARQENRNEKAIKVASEFFERVKTRTETILIPAIIKRFNLPEKHVENPDNADLLKKELEKGKMHFKYAVQLNILTRNLNDKQPEKRMSHAAELALLYAATNSININAKSKYMGELANYYASAPTDFNINFPSLEALRPYFAAVGKFAYEKVKGEIGQTMDFFSFVTREMTPEQREIFLKKAQKAEALEFAWMGAKEATRGSIAIGKDSFNLISRSLGILKEDWAQVEDLGDFITLIFSKGANIIVSTDEEKQGLGVINVGYKNFIFKPIGIFCESIRDAAKGEGSSGLKTYAIGTAPYVAIGAAWGGVVTGWGKPGLAKGAHMLEGALKTLAAPAYLPAKATWWTYKSGRWGVESGQTIFNVTRDLLKYRKLPRNNVNIMMRNAQFVKHYYELMPLEGYLEEARRIWHKGGIRQLGQRIISPNWNRRMMIKYARKFKNRYNKFFRLGGTNDAMVLHLGASVDELREIKKTAQRMEDVMQRLLKTPDEKLVSVIEQLAKESNPHGGLKGSLLSAAERNHLLERIKTPKELRKFRGMLNNGAHYIEGRSFWSRFRKGGITEAFVGKLAKQTDVGKIQKMLSKKGLKLDKGYAELIAGTKNTDDIKYIIEEVEKELAPTMTTESRLAKLKKAITEKAGKAKEVVGRKLTDAYKNVAKRVDRYARTKGNVEKMLKNAQSDLSIIEKEMARAGKMKNVAKAEELIKKAENAKREMQQLLAKLDELRKAEEAMKSMKGSDEALQLSRKAVEKAMEASSKAFRVLGKSSKLMKFLKVLKFGGRIAGKIAKPAFFFAAPAIGAWEGGKHFYEAITTDVEGRGGIEAAMGGVYMANAAVDTAFAVSLLGKGGARVKLVGRAWVPALPVIYAAEKIYDVAVERTRTEAEWIQRHSYDDLVHQWFTTYKGVNLGESWIAGFKASPFEGPTAKIEALKRGEKPLSEEVDKGIEEKRETMHKMYRVLITANKNPEIYNIIYSEKPQEEKDKQINALVDKTYTKYHEYYFRESIPTSVNNYEEALKFIADAQLFDDIMHEREQRKSQGREFKIGIHGTFYNLMDDRYEITGTAKNPKVKDDFAPYLIVGEYKKQLLTFDKKENPHLEENLESMDTFYLLRLYVQINEISKDPAAQAQLANNPEIVYALGDYAAMIRNYLICKRGIHFKLALANPKLFEPKMKLEEILGHLNDFDVKNSPSYQKFEKEIPSRNKKPGVYALYRLAEYFGYTGDPDEETLKAFFSEEKEELHGIYWDGSEWHIFNPGLSLDITLDEQDLGKEKFISELVKRFYQHANDVLGYRHRSFLVSTTEYFHDAQCFNFVHQVKNMANILQNGYNESIRKYHSGKKEIGHIAPRWGYKSEEPEGLENFEQDYTSEIKRMKATMNWSQLDFEIQDQNTIELKRLDSAEKTKITKSGETWNIEDYATRLTFIQAVAMGNLLNWTKGKAEKHNWRAGAKHPFEIDGDDIDFDKTGVWDTTVLDGDRKGDWVKFYGQIGISPEKMVDIMNNWWEKEKKAVTT